MKVEWDYTNLAQAYLKRPEYAQGAIDRMVETAGMSAGKRVCDVGAGAAHLTLMLARKGYEICAVEPNDAMRANGIKKTADYPSVKWFDGVGEQTGMESGAFDLVTFGSSFNVCDQAKALIESDRILKPHGWFACMWNHRDLTDHLQGEIEKIITKHVEGYSYGRRREDQTEIIRQSGLFLEPVFIQDSVTFDIPAEDFIEGWKSHGTVQRQAKEQFDAINDEIRTLVLSLHTDTVKVPYTTRIWMAQKKK